MAKNKTAYLVLLGSIQDTNALIPAGELFTPATTEYAAELLEAGIIGPAPAVTAKEKAAEAKAQADAEAKAQADAEAKAQAEADAAAQAAAEADEDQVPGDGEEHDDDAGSTADDAATE